MKIIGIIPARGGSKGIPRKNIKMIAGKPLIVWTIDAAKESKLMNDFYVSTEDDEIAQISKSLGAKIIKRPAELASDKSNMIDVLKHFVKETKADVVVILQPTSPVREKNLIDKCVKKFLDTKADNLTTGFICKFYEFNGKCANRQEKNGFFYDDGNIYIIKSELIMQNKIIGEKSEEYILSHEQNAEIDEPFDFWINEKILEELKKDKDVFKKMKI